jgi:hypothetical protein
MTRRALKPSSVLAALLLGLVVAASCRNGDKPPPILPGAPTADAGPERALDGGADPIGPLAGGGSVRDAAGDGR